MAVYNRCGGYQRSLGAALIKVAGMWLSRMRRLYDNVDYFITPSAFTREKMIRGGFSPERIVHIPTWIDTAGYEGNQICSPGEILYVGRLSHEKGVETLLEAMMLLKNQSAHLTIVGDDTTPYALQLKDSFANKLGTRIHFPGFQNQKRIGELFSQATCFVVPSVCYENQPNVVLEGMAHARPAVVSDHGSLREMVMDGQTGYLFEAGNASDLSDKLDKLLQNLKESREMGIRAREYVVKNHSIESHLSFIEALFEKCLRK
jgi:glycosyltransferase involved in cell wall biosynthesis